MTTTNVADNNIKKVDPSKFAHGHSIMSETDWLVLIAYEHRRIKYPDVYPLIPGRSLDLISIADLSSAQIAFCKDYWNDVLAGPSEKALAMRRSLTRGRKIDCPELDSQIFIIEWDAQNNRAKKGTGQWVSYRGTKPRFRFGITPKSGKIAGWDVENTFRSKVDRISIRSKAALIQESATLIGCDIDEAKRIFEHRGKNKRD